MSRQLDMQTLALQLAEQTLVPTNGSLAHHQRLYGGVPAGRSTRRVVYEREQTHLFGRRPWERLTLELDQESGELR